LQISNKISVAEPLTLSGLGVSSGGALRNTSSTTGVTYSDNNIYFGAITLSSNDVRINSDSGTLTLSGSLGPITNGAINLTLGGSGNISVGAVIGSGSGGLTKDGSGTVTFLATNTYTGLTTVSAGTLVLDQSGSTTGTVLSNSSAVTINGGTLQLNDSTETIAALTLTSGSITVGTTGNTLTATSYTLNPASGVSVSVSAVLAGSGITLYKIRSWYCNFIRNQYLHRSNNYFSWNFATRSC